MAFYGKFTDGKLSAVYRNGQSIGCCCQTEPACCMYSASTLGSGAIVAADLPDAITLLGVGSLSRSGTGYGSTTNGVIFETNVWAIYRNGVRITRNCLIQGDGNLTPGDDRVEDQFAATYEVTIVHSDLGTQVYTVTRTSLCRWEFGDPDDAVYVKIEYSSAGIWSVVYDNYDFPVFTEEIKVGSRSSPVGSYPGGSSPDLPPGSFSAFVADS